MNSSGRCEAPEFDGAIQEIRDALSGLQFGTVLIAVQDGVVVQIDRTEKRRLVSRKVKRDRPAKPESDSGHDPAMGSL